MSRYYQGKIETGEQILAEFTEIRGVERTKAGLAAVKERGRVGGRKRIMTPSKLEAAKKLLCEGMPPKDVAQNLGVSIPTLYRWCPAASR